MQGEVINLLHDMMKDLGGDTALSVLHGMGISDLGATFFTFA